MRISRKTHGALDYIVGVILILSPKLFGFDLVGGTAEQLPVVLAIAALIYSLLTKYELGFLKVLPFKAHLTLDVMSGLLLGLSPWLFQFADQVWMPHLVLGLIELSAVMMTQTTGSEHHTPPGATAAH